MGKSKKIDNVVNHNFCYIATNKNNRYCQVYLVDNDSYCTDEGYCIWEDYVKLSCGFIDLPSDYVKEFDLTNAGLKSLEGAMRLFEHDLRKWVIAAE